MAWQKRIKVQCYGDGVGGDCEHSLYRRPCEGYKLKRRIEEFNKKMIGDTYLRGEYPE